MSISGLDLNLLLVLHIVLLERNVARAAERLHVTPSAVSNSLARLRDALRDPLFTRQGRGIVPTPRALELQPTLQRALGELSRALESAPFDASGCSRTFTLATADVGQVAWLPKLVLAMQRQLPRAYLRVVGIDALVSLGDLGSAEVDVHVGVTGKVAGSYAETLLNEPMLLVARHGHPVPAKMLSRRALGELRHVRVEMVPGKAHKDPFAAAYARAQITRHVVLSVPSFSAAAEVVAHSDLVATMPASLLAAKGASLGVRPLKTPLPAHVVKLSMSWHERTHSDPAARCFRDLVRQAVTGELPRA